MDLFSPKTRALLNEEGFGSAGVLQNFIVRRLTFIVHRLSRVYINANLTSGNFIVLRLYFYSLKTN